MTRKIKFRAWDNTIFDETEKGRMLYENQQYGLSPQKTISDDCWTRFWESLARLKEHDYILMQFTGLKDKNGKEIYDQDKLIYRDESGELRTGFVEWCDFQWAIIAVNGDDEGNQDLEMHPDYSEDWEIIGNKLEKPELLEVKQDE